jgi:acylphosphatase
MSSEHHAARLVAAGRVQGVWYRQSCANEAARLGVGGWVRNLPDGRVEAWVEGPRPAVEALIAWCRRGPERAVVEHVEVSWEAPSGAIRFEVRR